MLGFATQEFIFNFFLIFSRLAGLISVLPALGDERIFVRARLSMCIFISVVAMSAISDTLPKLTNSSSQLTYYIISESLVGIMLGLCVRIYFTSILILGNLISMESGLSAATIYDPSQKDQIMLFSSFISILFLVTIFTSDTHHTFLLGFFESYEKFKPGELLDTGDIANTISQTVSNSFLLAFKISSPFMIIGVAILVAGGVLSRLMPTFQVFFVITPIQILIMFGVLYVVINQIISIIIDTMIGVF
jgi:flagellar biosynthetic protein FliR